MLSIQWSCAQVHADRPMVLNPDFDQKISQTISFTVATIGPEQLKQMQNVLVLDAREREEFEVSHIKGARYIGYNDFDPSILEDVPKDQKLVLYCSIGYRSEKIGERLQKQGFKNVYNLYGSIFEWVNQDNELIDKNGRPTKKVHTYNKNWSKWVDPKKAEKVW